MKRTCLIGFLLATVLTFGSVFGQQDEACTMTAQQSVSSYNQAVMAFGLTTIQQDEACTTLEVIPQRWMGLYNQKDLVGISALYTEDARFYASTGEIFEGRQAIQELFRGLGDRGATEATIEILEAEIVGDTAYAIGSQRFVNAEGQTAVEGYSLLVFKSMDGKWVIHRQIANRRMP